MKKPCLVLLVGGVCIVGCLACAARIVSAQSPASATKPTVYVYDFELDVVPARAANQSPTSFRPAPPTIGPSPMSLMQQPRKKQLTPEQETRKHASELVNWMSASIIAELQNAGYTANRLHANDVRPSSGVAIRGLFAEIDKENHWRRAVIHTADDSGKMQALVSVANLAKPDQTLYEIAPLPDNEPQPGAVITLSPYVPLTKYEIDKQADQAAFQALAARVVKDLTALLAANPTALTQ